MSYKASKNSMGARVDERVVVGVASIKEWHNMKHWVGARTRRHMLTLLGTVALMLALHVQVWAQPQLTWGGEWRGAVDATRVDDGVDVAAQGGLRLQGRTRTYPWRLFFDGRVDVIGSLAGARNVQADVEVDRLYVRLYLPSADVSVGKQAVNWGVGYAWAPTDIFGPPNPNDPSGIRPGIEAAVVQVPVGPLDYWSLAIADGKAGVRRRGHVMGTDWSLLAAVDQGDRLWGADLKGDAGVGWHLAAAYRIPDEESVSPSLQTLIGADYSWLRGSLVWVGEYLITHTDGWGSPAHQSAFGQLTYRVDEFTSVVGAVVADLTNEQHLWNLRVTTSLGQSQITAGLSLYKWGGNARAVPGPDARLKVEFSQAF